MGLIEGLWLLDLLNIVKYNETDVFDSILNISPGNWVALFIFYLVFVISMTFVKSLIENR